MKTTNSIAEPARLPPHRHAVMGHKSSGGVYYMNRYSHSHDFVMCGNKNHEWLWLASSEDIDADGEPHSHIVMCGNREATEEDFDGLR